MDKKIEGDFTRQVTKNHFEEKKANGKDEDEGLGKSMQVAELVE